MMLMIGNAYSDQVGKGILGKGGRWMSRRTCSPSDYTMGWGSNPFEIRNNEVI